MWLLHFIFEGHFLFTFFKPAGKDVTLQMERNTMMRNDQKLPWKKPEKKGRESYSTDCI